MTPLQAIGSSEAEITASNFAVCPKPYHGLISLLPYEVMLNVLYAVGARNCSTLIRLRP